jgi:predicted metal-dependent peptidase
MSKQQSQKTTENDLLHLNENVDPIKLKNFDLSRYLIGLISYEPFYSRILRSVNKVETESIQTAGVSTTVDKITLFWNRKFLASLDDKKVIGVLKHECLHLLYDHTTFRKRDPHIIWNYATDLSINTLLNQDELPEGGLIPGVKFEELSNEKMSKMTPEQIARYNNISELIGNLPPEKSADWYFEKLMNDDTIKDMIEKGEQQLNELKELLGKMDDHEAWGEMSDDEREQISQKIKEIIKDANIECQTKNSWGSVHQSIQKEIRRLLYKEISWKDVLKRFIGFSSRNERTQTVTRLNRKYPGVHAGIMKEYKPKIAVYIDESGSVDDSSLEKFFSELHNLSNFCDFSLFKFDTNVDDSTRLEFKKGKKHNLNRQCTGGTDFNAPTVHANKTRNEFDGMIIMTDGDAPKPVSSRIRRCWVLCNNNDLYFGNENADAKDFLVKMSK